MSALSLYVDQILRPSWLPNYESPCRRPAQPIANEKRRQVKACLKNAPGPVNSAWVIDYTGYTKQSVMHILYSLAEVGEVRRIDGGRVLLWEAS